MSLGQILRAIRVQGAAPGPEAYGYLAWPHDIAVSTTFTPAAAIIHVARVELQRSALIGNFICAVTTAGTAYTNTQLGLYSSSGAFLGASGILASAGTNTFGTTGVKTVPLSAAVAASPGTYYVAVHAGTNSATAFILRSMGVAQQFLNAGIPTASARSARATGHATNALATIGNLNTATWTVNGTLVDSPWIALAA